MTLEEYVAISKLLQEKFDHQYEDITSQFDNMLNEIDEIKSTLSQIKEKLDIHDDDLSWMQEWTTV